MKNSEKCICKGPWLALAWAAGAWFSLFFPWGFENKGFWMEMALVELLLLVFAFASHEGLRLTS